jgi:hypothetical protein
VRDFAGLTPTDLGDNPELAVLHILDRVLDAARLVLVAAHPQLNTGDPGAEPVDLEAFAARNVLIAAHALQEVLALYRDATAAESRWIRLALVKPPDCDF